MKRMGMLGAAIAVTAGLAACQPSLYPMDVPNSEVASDTVETSEVTPADNSRDTGKADKDTSETPAGGGTDTGNTGDVKAIIDDFLAGTGSMVVKSDRSGYLEAGKSYTFDEMISAMDAKIAENWDDDTNVRKVRVVDSGLIDLGSDGVPELALRFEEYDDNRYFDEFEIAVFMVMDGKLTLVDDFCYGYRAYGEINKYGVIYTGGSGGANLHIDAYSIIDDEGNTNYIYQEEVTMMLEQPKISYYHIPESVRPDDYPDDSFDENGYTCYQYTFVNYEGTGTDEEYDNYLINCIYVFEDQNGNAATPSDELMKLYDSIGIEVTDRDGINKVIQARKDKLGVTDEMMAMPDENPANAVDWSIIYESDVKEGQGGEN